MEIQHRVRTIIAETLGHSYEEVGPGVCYIDDLGLDQIDIITLAMALEDAFGIQMCDNMTEQCTSFDACLTNVNALREAA